ncbi:MAG: alpha-glucan family phosphorylase [Ilumatobacter sp.]|nr:alpha-glucan family phosphorylase [Ilumatobacter sp.]
MRPNHLFNVVSEIPEALRDIPDLAANLHWAWDRQLAAIFDRLDGSPEGRPWRLTGQHPVDLVRRTSPTRWHELAADDAFVDEVRAARARLTAALDGPTWFTDRQADPGSPLSSVAYFSPEFGITEALPQYSGGLGVLAGDHLKASSDLGVPLIGVGLLYAEGYFHQQLNSDGWQEERNERIDPASLGIRPTGRSVEVELAGVIAKVNVWRVDVGRIELYLLDTNDPENPPEIVAITNRLYGGDEQHRLRQEIVLGIGGVRALRALDIHPQVFHTNEGHAGFLGLERVREFTDAGLTFVEAIEAARAGGVFTTHTPVPAGIDRFPRELFEPYFTQFAQRCGIDIDELFDVGTRADEPDGKFNMAVMGLRLAARANGVAQLHGEVSRAMFGGMWPELPPSDTPIGHVTNGVHARSWVSDRTDELLTAVIGDNWHLTGPDDWARVHDIDDRDIWAVRRAGRQELVDMVRERLGHDLLDPDVLTIGFARRFATYKRANLLLAQMDRLKALLLDADRPVQFVFAGKAHPADHPGKSLIQEIAQLAADADVHHRFVFIPDYDIGIARTMYHGCDVWLNTPRRPNEACGTSGEKAALNGVLNCSISDGWWAEMSTGDNGFDIPSFDDDHDLVRRDRREASATFDVIEREIVPLFYERADGVPHGWIGRVKVNWATLGWNVVAARMVRDYVTTLYEPAAATSDVCGADGAAVAKELAAWKSGVATVWDSVSVELLDGASDLTDGASGLERDVRVRVDPGKLRLDELVVQVVHGPIASDGTFDERRMERVTLEPGDGGIFTGAFTPTDSGPWGVTARALPSHPGLSSIYDTGLVALG